MKMNKILASGVAATMAVTSLAAVASAADRTFDMKVTEGKYTYVPKCDGVSEDLDAAKFGLKVGSGASATGYTTKPAAEVNVDTNFDGEYNFKDFDEFIPVNVTWTDADLKDNGFNLTVTIKGQKADDQGNVYSITEKATLIRMNVYGTGSTPIANYILPIYATSAPTGSFMPGDFASVDNITIEVDGIGSETLDVEEEEYKALEKLKAAGKSDTLQAHSDANTFYILGAGTTAAKATVELVQADTNDAKGQSYKVVGGATTNNVSTLAKEADGTVKISALTANKVTEEDLRKEIASLMSGIEVLWQSDKGETKDKEAWLPITDTKQKPGTLERNEVLLLSKTGDHESEGAQGNDGNQTYDYNKDYDYNEGNKPNGFAGLASQVADFFNKQLNGTITFHFAAGVTTSDDAWLNGGIPSTEVGIKNTMGQMTANDVALFVNYGSTTGSLQAVTELNAESLEVVFTMDEILEALGGQTIGTVQDIYYGMVKGVKYDNGTGFWVDKVVLAYDEDADDSDIGDEDEGDEGDVDVDDGEDEGDDGDVDVDVDGGEDEGDGEVDGDTDEDDFPTDEDEAGEDGNPNTGVALAVVPALMAAAAVVVSKKRK